MYILDPDPPARTVPPETITIAIELAPGKPQNVTIPLTPAMMDEAIDVLYRVGGRELVDHFRYELAVHGLRSATPSQWAAALALMEDAIKRQTIPIVEALLALDTAVQGVFLRELDHAGPPLRLSRYGLAEANAVHPPVTDAGRPTYRRLRATIIDLARRRRRVTRWTMTIPDNAPHAREQYRRDFEPYMTAYRGATSEWPSLAACGPELMKRIGNANDRDLQRWANEPDQDGTRLDDYIKEALKKTWQDYVDEKPSFATDQIRKASNARTRLPAQAALRRGELSDEGYTDALAAQNFGPEGIDVDRERGLDPETFMAEKHPLFRHPFLIQAAAEELRWQSGDLGYAAAISVMRSAKTAAAAESERRRRIVGILGWSTLGFGILAFVPVIGVIAVAASIATSVGLAFSSSLEYIDANNRRQAVGPLADRFGFDDPEAAGFIVDLLGLAADVALPVLGKAIGAVLRPGGRVLAAARVSLEAAESGLDLTGMIIDANDALLQSEMNRLGLAQGERSN